VTHRERPLTAGRWVGALLVAAFALVACGGSTGGGGTTTKYIVGVSNTLQGNGWREEMICSIKAQAKVSGVVSKVIIANRNTDAAGQIADMRNLISSGANVIVINPSDRDALNPVMAAFIDHVSFLVLATSDGAGSVDASPRGGPPGFVRRLDDQHVAALDRGIEVLEDPHHARGVGGRAVGGDGHEVHLARDLDVAHEVGQKEHRPLEHADQDQVAAVVVARDLDAELPHAVLEVVGLHEDLADRRVAHVAQASG